MSATDKPVDLPEPKGEGFVPHLRDRKIWIRGLQMLIFAVLFGIAETVLLVATVIQFGWMLVYGERNKPLARFGEALAKWLADVARFQTGASEDKPFPWAGWK